MKKVFKKQEVIDYTHEGNGVVKVDDFVYFIPGVLKGEIIDFEETANKKKFGFGKVTEIIKPSNERLEVEDAAYTKSGHAQLLHMSYPEQIKFKKGVIENLLRKNNIDVKLTDFIENEQNLNYRNKAVFTFAKDKDYKVYLGYNESKSNKVVKIDECLLVNPVINKIKDLVEEFFNKQNERIFNRENKAGNLYQLLVRQTNTGEIGIALNTFTGKLKGKEAFIKFMTENVEGIKTIVINKYNIKGSRYIFDYENKIYGEGYLTEKLDGLTFLVNINSFFQVNPHQTEKLYNVALDSVDWSGKKVLDAYCGTGTLTLLVAKKAKEVVGIEMVESAIKDAKQNMKLNGIRNVSFVQNKVEFELANIDKVKYDALIVDPPRTGLHPGFVELLQEKKIKEIVYISCNPATLIRDISKLTDLYNIESITGVDMFSQTYHIESVVKLSLK